MGLSDFLGKTIENTYDINTRGDRFPEPRTKIGRFLYLGTTVVLLSALAAMMLDALNRQNAFTERGIETNGTIIEVSRKVSLNPTGFCYQDGWYVPFKTLQVTVEYRDRLGKVHAGSSIECSSRIALVEDGEETRLHYRPENPSDIVRGDSKSLDVALRSDIFSLTIHLIMIGVFALHALYLNTVRQYS